MAREDDARDSRLEVCNDAYYGAGEDIATALIGYLQRHRDEIHLPRRTVLAS